TILCQCYYNKYIPSLLQRLTFTHDAEDKKLSPKIDIRDRDSSEITSGHIFQVDVPLLCVDKNYRFLYSYLIRHHKAVPLGLYRHVIHKKEGM
ncbi:931_t:CDS:2, partial [Acaulospora morrowiae]